MSYDTKDIVIDFKEVLTKARLFDKVDYTRNESLEQEDVFPSCYIVPHTNAFDSNGKATAGIEGYDSIFLITLKIHTKVLDNDPVGYLDLQDSIVREVLRDSNLWRYTLDRDVKMAVWDFNEYFPKKEGQITFEFKLRLC